MIIKLVPILLAIVDTYLVYSTMVAVRDFLERHKGIKIEDGKTTYRFKDEQEFHERIKAYEDYRKASFQE